MAAVYRTKFVVTGKGPFPIDMLRYDRCYPVEAKDSQAVASSLQVNMYTGISVSMDAVTKEIVCESPIMGEEYSVCLATVRSEKSNAFPSESRWRSFGWRVSGVDGPTRI